MSTHVNEGIEKGRFRIQHLFTNVSLFEWVQTEAIWSAMLLSLIVYVWDLKVGNVVLFSYLLLQHRHSGRFMSWLITFVIFLSLGLFASHRFDTGKIATWTLLSILPFMVYSLLMKVAVMDPQWLSAVRSFLLKVLQSIGMHWIFYSVILGNLIALVARDMIYVYGGVALVLICLLLFVDHTHFKQMLAVGLTMVVVYILQLHLIMWKGILLPADEMVRFAWDHWDTILIPVWLVVIYVLQNLFGRKGKTLP